MKRIRTELGYKGRLVQLIDDNRRTPPTPTTRSSAPAAGLAEVARLADGIGPPLHHIAKRKESGVQLTALVRDAHELKLEVHPFTFRADALPAGFASIEELLTVFLVHVGVDGLFTDHPDRALAFVRARAAAAPTTPAPKPD